MIKLFFYCSNRRRLNSVIVTAAVTSTCCELANRGIIYRIWRMDNTDILSFSVMRAVQLVVLFSATGYQLYLDWIHYLRYVSSGKTYLALKDAGSDS